MQLEIFDNRRGAVSDVPLHEATRSRYLNYALSVITSRALPDVRDGLKPVQRRILYAMLHNLHLRPDGRYRKSAAVVGEVMAKYHPHGDSAIYDAMVRMAQDFSLRYPLVDGQGNFGSIDGDRAAAMRYTECKLRELAIELLNELKRKTVPMRVNYDGTLEEPVVLPAQVPNLLINGVTGIAVGMATNIPPHNLSEVIDACAYLVDHQKEEEPDLSPFVKGPDFPTGGQILNTPEELKKIYAKGEGPVSIQGEWTTEVIDRKRYILLTSIPFNVVKADLVTQIADHIAKGKIPQLVDIRDESTDDIRVVIEMKRGADPEVAMAYLFKHTNLQTKFHVNMTVLCPTDNPEVGAPAKLGLVPVLRHFLDFRFEVVTKRLEHQLKELLDRIHILEGFEKVFDHLDEAIAIIRASDDRKDAGTRLKARFELTDIQSDAILDTRLHKLARMEILAIREELAEKRAEAARIQALLGSPRRLWALVKSELLAIKDTYGDPRRTKISGPTKVVEFDPDAYIVNEPCCVIVTRGGWIKRQKSFKTVDSIRVREGDEVGWIFETSTRQSVTYFTDKGSAYTLRVDDIPATTGYGEPIQVHFQFGDGERLIAVIPQDDALLPKAVPPPGAEDEASSGGDGGSATSGDDEATGPEPALLAVSRGGKCLRLPLSSFADPSTKSGRKYARLNKKFKGDGIVGVFPSGGDELVTIATKKARALVFPAHQVKLLRGAGMGVTAIKLSPGDWVLDYRLARGKGEGVKVTTNRGREVIVGSRQYNVASRGGKGQAIITRGSIELDKPEPLVMMKEDASDSSGEG